jgi:hypothetical protein
MSMPAFELLEWFEAVDAEGGVGEASVRITGSFEVRVRLLADLAETYLDDRIILDLTLPQRRELLRVLRRKWFVP